MKKPRWSNEEDLLLSELYPDTPDAEIQEELKRQFGTNRSLAAIEIRAGILFLSKNPKQYAFYKGDNLEMIGTKQELAEYRGVRVETISFYLSNVHKKRVEQSKNPSKRIMVVGL